MILSRLPTHSLTYKMITLSPPVSRFDHQFGFETAPVTLVEYGDFTDAVSGAAYWKVKEVLQAFGGQIRFVFRSFPRIPERRVKRFDWLDLNRINAQVAAEAAEAANAQGQFWKMYTYLFSHQSRMSEDLLFQYAAILNLDTDRFKHDLAEHVHAPRVELSYDSGIQSGVLRPPTFFINGVHYKDEFEMLSSAVEESLTLSTQNNSVRTTRPNAAVEVYHRNGTS